MGSLGTHMKHQLLPESWKCAMSKGHHPFSTSSWMCKTFMHVYILQGSKRCGPFKIIYLFSSWAMWLLYWEERSDCCCWVKLSLTLTVMQLIGASSSDVLVFKVYSVVLSSISLIDIHSSEPDSSLISTFNNVMHLMHLPNLDRYHYHYCEGSGWVPTVWV